jgi:hypothetical protein
MSSSYELKYLKYKQKYLMLKNQIAGTLSIDCPVITTNYASKVAEITQKENEYNEALDKLNTKNSLLNKNKSALAEQENELKKVEKQTFFTTKGRTDATDPIKTIISGLNEKITSIESKIPSISANVKQLKDTLTLLKTQRDYIELTNNNTLCKVEESYKKMFSDNGLPVIEFLIKDSPDLEHCRHLYGENHEIKGASDKAKYYIIIDEDNEDIFIYCNKCGIRRPQIIKSSNMPLTIMENNKKLLLLSIKPEQTDRRFKCFYKTTDGPLRDLVTAFCARIGDPIDDKLKDGRRCNNVPKVLSIKFNYDNLINFRDTKAIKNNNYDELIKSLNGELKNLTELKVKSLRVLTV